MLPLAVALQIAASCSPAVAPETLLSVVHTESRFDTWAIGDNTARTSHHPATLADAVALASRLIAAGHSLDLGAAQISWSAGHIQRRGLPLSAAFDPCTALRVGGEVLADCYRRAAGVEQVRLRQALSCYNTGTLNRGAAYAARVWRIAAEVVPAIQIAGPYRAPAAPEDTVAPEPPRPPPGMEDALHAGPPVPDDAPGLVDAFHRPSSVSPKEPAP